MILPLEEALFFTLTSLQFQYYVRNDYFLNVIVRTQKNIGILFEQFLSHFPINFPSASFTHSSLPFTLSLFTFPTLRFDVNFKAIFAHSFSSFAPVSKKKKKISVFLRRSLTFIFVPLSLLSIPTCALSLTHPPSLFPRDGGGWSKPPEVTRRTGEFRVNFYSNVTRTYTSLKKRGSDLGLLLHLFDKVY